MPDVYVKVDHLNRLNGSLKQILVEFHDAAKRTDALQDMIGRPDGRTGAYQAAVPLPAPAGDVTLAYLADGMHLVVASRDGRTWVADVDRDGWMDRACRLAGRNLTAEEWRRYFPGRSPEATCPQWATTG